MTLHNGKEMTNYCEEDDDDIEWKLAMPKLSLKTDLKWQALQIFYKLHFAIFQKYCNLLIYNGKNSWDGRILTYDPLPRVKCFLNFK